MAGEVSKSLEEEAALAAIEEDLMQHEGEILASAVGEEVGEEAGKRPMSSADDQEGRSDIHEKVTFAVDTFYVIYDPTHTLYTQRHTYLHSSGDLTLHEGVWDLDIVLRFYGRPRRKFGYVFQRIMRALSIGVVAVFKLTWMVGMDLIPWCSQRLWIRRIWPPMRSIR
jgi:hypothetical protein